MTRTHPDYGVFIVRGQPITLAHLDNIEAGLTACERLIVVLGSSFSAPRWDLVPFREYNRFEMLLNCLTYEQTRRIDFIYLKDYGNMTTWATKLTEKVYKVIGDDRARVALVGHSKDQPTGYYLSQFPNWEQVATPLFRDGLNATHVRNIYFSDIPFSLIEDEFEDYVHKGAIDFLGRFRKTIAFDHLLAEKTFMIDYLKQFYDPAEVLLAKAEGRKPNCAPYPPAFYTADMPTIQGNLQLMVQRAQYPGKGLWAHPGGHCEGLTSLDAAIKELREETGLSIPEPVLRGSIVGSKVYEDPNRSTRRRTITHAHFVHLQPQRHVPPGNHKHSPRGSWQLPKVRPSHESMTVEWRPLDMPREEYFEDHWQMTNDALALINR